jgi:hypothetical protein
MKNREKNLTDRIFTRLVRNPGILCMSQFSMQTPKGLTFCLGGLILDESGIRVTYNSQGQASGLAKGQRAPSPYWVNKEVQRLVGVDGEGVLMPAKARELWAAEHGEYAGRVLPLYPEDWETGMTYERITPEMVLAFLTDVKNGLHKVLMPLVAKVRAVEMFRAVA